MSLSYLTTSGWLWFAWCLYCAFGLLLSNRKNIDNGNALISAVSFAWLCWLVTP